MWPFLWYEQEKWLGKMNFILKYKNYIIIKVACSCSYYRITSTTHYVSIINSSTLEYQPFLIVMKGILTFDCYFNFKNNKVAIMNLISTLYFCGDRWYNKINNEIHFQNLLVVTIIYWPDSASACSWHENIGK